MDLVVKKNFGRVTGTFTAMNTPCTIVVYVDSRKDGEHAVAEARNEAQRIEKKYSRFNEQSIISRINRESWKTPISVDQETALLLDFAAICCNESQGSFDISCGALYEIWRNGRKEIPSNDEVEDALQHVGWNKVKWDGNHISLATEKMKIDFGGIGKEYAADRALAVLRAHGIEFGIVNFGGDIAVLGGKPDGRGWMIGISNQSKLIVHAEKYTKIASDHAIEAWEGGVATSGTTERYIEIAGVRFSHVMNARKGRPLVGDFSFTVTHSSCLAAGALASQKLLEFSSLS